MKRYVVLGVNENPKYLYYLPLIKWAWAQFGWNVFLFYVGKVENKFYNTISRAYYHSTWKEGDIIWIWHDIILNTNEGYKSETIAQVSRLYSSAVNGLWSNHQDSWLMTSDTDMLPLSDYWQIRENSFVTYGRDLTDYHFPICYLAGHYNDWQDVMSLQDIDYQDAIQRDLRQQKNMWGLDQDIVTERINSFTANRNRRISIDHINRGTDKRTGYPIGRIDRSHWTLDHPKYIDAHLPHDILTNDASFHKVMELLHTVWPKEDFKWFVQYTKEFKKLL